MEAVTDFKSNNAALFSSRFSTLPSSIKLKGGHGGHQALHHLPQGANNDNNNYSGSNNNNQVILGSSSTGALATVNRPRTGNNNSNSNTPGGGRGLQGSFLNSHGGNNNTGMDPTSTLGGSKSSADMLQQDFSAPRPSTASGVFATIRNTLQSSPKLGKARKYLATPSNNDATTATGGSAADLYQDSLAVPIARQAARSFDAIADQSSNNAAHSSNNNNNNNNNIVSSNEDGQQHPRKSSWPSINRNHSGGTATLIATNPNPNSPAAAASSSSSSSTTLPAPDEHINNNAPVVGFMSLFNRAKAKQAVTGATTAAASSAWSTTSRSPLSESPQSLQSESPPLSPKGVNDRTSDLVAPDAAGSSAILESSMNARISASKVLSPRSSPLAINVQQQVHRNSPVIASSPLINNSGGSSQQPAGEVSLPSFHDKLVLPPDEKPLIKPVVSHASNQPVPQLAEDSIARNNHEATAVLDEAASSSNYKLQNNINNNTNIPSNSSSSAATSSGSRATRGSRPAPPSASSASKGVRFADPISTSESYAMHTLKTTTNNILKLAKGMDPFHHSADGPTNGNSTMPRSVLRVKISPQYLALLQSNQVSSKKSAGGVNGSPAAGNPMVNHLGNLVYPSSGGSGFAAGIAVLPTSQTNNAPQDLFSMASPISSTINTINTMNNTLSNKHILPVANNNTITNSSTAGILSSQPQAAQYGSSSVPASPTATSAMVRDSMVVQKTLAEIHRRYGIQGQQSTAATTPTTSLSSSMSMLPAVQQYQYSQSDKNNNMQYPSHNSAANLRSGTPIPAQVRKQMRQQSQGNSAPSNNNRPSTAPAGSGSSGGFASSGGSFGAGNGSLDDFVNAAVFTLFSKSIQVNQVIVRSHSANHNGGVNFYASHLTFSFPANDYNRTLVMQYKDISAVNLTGNKLRLKGGISNDAMAANNTTSSTVVMEFAGSSSTGSNASNTTNNAALATIRERIIPMIMSQSFSR